MICCLEIGQAWTRANYLPSKEVSPLSSLTRLLCTDELTEIPDKRTQSAAEGLARQDDVQDFHRWIKDITLKEVKSIRNLSRVHHEVTQSIENMDLDKTNRVEVDGVEPETISGHHSNLETGAGPAKYSTNDPAGSLSNEPSDGKEERSVTQKIDDWLNKWNATVDFLSSTHEDTKGKGRAD